MNDIAWGALAIGSFGAGVVLGCVLINVSFYVAIFFILAGILTGHLCVRKVKWH